MHGPRILIIDEGQLDSADAIDLIRTAEIVLVRVADGYVCRKNRAGRNEDVQLRWLPGSPPPFVVEPLALSGASG